MTVVEAAATLKSAGCEAEYKNSLLIISKIPSWTVYALAFEFARDLAKVAMVKHIFTRIDPIPYQEDKGNACSFCEHKQMTECPYLGQEHRIPIAIERKGCQIFKAGNHVYF